MALVSILIVTALAKVTLAQFGLTQKEAAPAGTPATANVQEIDGDDDVAVAQASPSKRAPDAKAKATAPGQPPSNSLDKARAVQGLVDGQAAKAESQIESEGK